DTVGNIKTQSIAYWDGLSWGKFYNGLWGFDLTIIGYNSKLYAGGQFTWAGSSLANNIAYWTGPESVNELNVNNCGVQLFPNPNNGAFTLQVNSEKLKVNSVVEVYNVLGEKIYTAPLPAPEKETSTSAISIKGQAQNGIYFYRIISSDNKELYSGKFIIQD